MRLTPRLRVLLKAAAGTTITCLLIWRFLSLMDSEEEVFRDPSDQARIRLTFARQHLERRRSENRKMPESLEEVFVGMSKDRRAYLELDPWNRAIRLSLDSSGYQLRSAGPDGVFNSSDDVVVAGTAKCVMGCGNEREARGGADSLPEPRPL